MEQLEENLGALDLRLSPEYEAALEEASRPKLNFPAAFSPSRDPILTAGLPSTGRLSQSPVRAKERR